MVAVSIIATLILLAIVGVASAQIVKIDVPDRVCHNSDFYCIVTFAGDTNYEESNLIVKVDGKKFDEFSDHLKRPASDVVQFGPINFESLDMGSKIECDVQYIVNYKYYFYDVSHDKKYIPDSKTQKGKVRYCPKEPIRSNIVGCPDEVSWKSPLTISFNIDDEAFTKPFGEGDVRLTVRSLSSNYTLADNISIRGEGSGMKGYSWSYPKLTKTMIDEEFNVSVLYTNPYHMNFITNRHIEYPKSCCCIKIVEVPPPDIEAYLDEKELSEERNTTIYLEEDANLSFKAKIEDYVEAVVTLKLDVNKNNKTYCNCTWNRTIKGAYNEPSSEVYDDECNILFQKERKDFTLILNYNNKLYNKTYRYNLSIIPFYKDFENATVNPTKGGYWNDTFKYTVWVNASKDLTIALYVFDPCLESWPWIHVANKKYNKYGGKTLNWTIHGKTIFSENCSGKSKFYFEYEGKETEVYLGPNLGLNEYVGHNGPSPKEPPEFNNGTTNPKVTIYRNWSQSSTPCNYSVDVNSEDDYTVRLFVKDPDTGERIRKGETKEISNTTKDITWPDITPFESLNIDNISQYIDNGTRANFTFEYNGHKANKNFSGPLLVGAFKEPRIELRTGDEEINYNDPFNYSINVYGSKRLNITLMYRENPNGEWITDGIEVPTRQYNNTFNWTSPPLKWGCRAIKSWAEVKMEVEIEGEQKHIKVD